MAASSLTPEQIGQISGLVAGYISNQRERFLPDTIHLSEAQMASMTGFFRPELLGGTQIVVLTNRRIENPDFYPILDSLGFSNLPDFSQMDAITFNDVVVSHVPFTEGLLFHELVHVEQYRQLGVQQFANLYVRGFLRGGSYEAIPLEANAYSLGRMFEGNPRQPFPVDRIVSEWIREGRF